MSSTVASETDYSSQIEFAHAIYFSRAPDLSAFGGAAAGASLLIFEAGQRPPWISAAEPDRWAPEIHEVDGKLHLLYAARHDRGDLRVAAAISDHVEGPWRDLGPILESPYGVIDATATRDPRNGRWLLLYKPDNNSAGQPTPIVSQGFALREERLVLTGRENQLMVSGPLESGEAVAAARHAGVSGSFVISRPAPG